jgi:phage shock protein PspC (stress-responsive transcriptional regulator)
MDHMTLTGHAAVFPLTPDAKRRLVTYLDRASTAVREDPDGDEIVRDLETGIGDRLQAVLDAGATVLDEQTVYGILEQAGPIETEAGAPRFRSAPVLCRIEKGKQIGGLCLGLATRTELRVDWLRSTAVILGLFTGGLLILVYLVTLLFVPRLQTVEEYRNLIDQDRRRKAR